MDTNLRSHKINACFFDKRQDTILTWLGMAGALVNARGTILLIDPLISLVLTDGQELCEGEYFLKIPLPIEAKDIPRVDVVLYTHADNDHFGVVSARIFADKTLCRFIAPPPVQNCIRELGVDDDRIITAYDDDTIHLANLDIIVTPALHNWQEQNPWKRGDCCGYLIRTPDGTIWHPGDTRLIPELLHIRGVDVLFFDVAAVESHLGPAGSAKLAQSSGAKVMIAYHYGTFNLPAGSFGNCDPEDSLRYLTEVSADFLQLNPGEPFKLPL
jgi:L-ascorbate metabolism protein UlaG (beta-lactamase superfamily)